VYDGIPCQVKQRAGDRDITAEYMEKSEHTDFNEDTVGRQAALHTLFGEETLPDVHLCSE